MALVPTFLDVTYRDDANTTRTIRYRMSTSFNTDGTNIADVVLEASDLETALAALTGDHIDYYDVIFRQGGAQHAVDDSANNQITAFVRTTLSNNDAGEFQVPAWRTTSYDMNDQLMLDAAFLTAAQTVADMLRDPETGLTMDTVEWAQSRTRKLRGKRIG